MLITAMVGIALGLFISAIVKTSEMATSMVPLILIPQILFCGLVGVPENMARVISTVVPATWAYDGIKRFSTLDTLDEEGSDPMARTKGRDSTSITKR
jgi:ABC-2 type transport system permease protein